MKENETKLRILKQARDLPKDKGLAFHDDRLSNQVAIEMIEEGLVLGSVSEYDTACITGIRDAGIEYLKNQTPHRKAIATFKRVAFVLYSAALLAIGYILNLDSVKQFLSDLIGKVLQQ